MPRSHDTITFGTDGWRAIIARDYTFDNLARVVHATASWLLNTAGPEPSVTLGHDTRFLGRAFSEHAASVFASRGIVVHFSDDIAATPAVSYMTLELGCDAGIVITASHNPAIYNGFKIKGPYGGSALPEMIDAVEKEIPPPDHDFADPGTFSSYIDTGIIKLHNFRKLYLDMIREKVDLDVIRDAGLRLGHDAMFGAGQGMFTDLLGPDTVIEMRSEINPGFGGNAPEPIEKNLAGLSAMVVEEGCSAGIANDGDADRIGMFDEKGQFVDSHKLLALLIRFLHEDKGQTGDIVKTLSTTDMLDVMGKKYGLHVHTTPIGFKYIGGYMLEHDVLVGGEESGGMAVKGHLPERDGIYIGMLILEMMSRRGKYLSTLVAELEEDFGFFGYHRVDVHTSPEAKEAALELLRSSGGLSEIAKLKVESVDTTDGVKHRTAEGWVLIRPSGTEPVLRIYAEASSTELAVASVEDTIRQLGV
ncbi:MAG: phosphoglucomutase/phosphomannomutase family protein [Bacteroidetes bacterium]|nr:MAG: phosphoglucomutase/phosphomannomutase family protein [Bacteroidota bacterium]